MTNQICDNDFLKFVISNFDSILLDFDPNPKKKTPNKRCFLYLCNLLSQIIYRRLNYLRFFNEIVITNSTT